MPRSVPIPYPGHPHAPLTSEDSEEEDARPPTPIPFRLPRPMNPVRSAAAPPSALALFMQQPQAQGKQQSLSLTTPSKAIAEIFKSLEDLVKEVEGPPHLQRMIAQYGLLVEKQSSAREDNYRNLLVIESKYNNLKAEYDSLKFVVETTKIREQFMISKEKKLKRDVLLLRNEVATLKAITFNQSNTIKNLHKTISTLSPGFFSPEESLLRCEICMNLYSDSRYPVVGRCGHSVCLHCVEQWKQADCMICRMPHSFSSKPGNFLATGLLALIHPFIKKEEVQIGQNGHMEPLRIAEEPLSETLLAPVGSEEL